MTVDTTVGKNDPAGTCVGIRGLDSTTVIGANAVTYELSERSHAIGHGGIGMMIKLARNTGLIDAIDRRLHLLKVHAPYQESDHVMTIMPLRTTAVLSRLVPRARVSLHQMLHQTLANWGNLCHLLSSHRMLTMIKWRAERLTKTHVKPKKSLARSVCRQGF